MMRYIGLPQILPDATFACFLVSWLITRQILFLFVIISTYTDLPRLVPYEWAPERGRYLSKQAWIIFCALLSALQVIFKLSLCTDFVLTSARNRFCRPFGSG